MVDRGPFAALTLALLAARPQKDVGLWVHGWGAPGGAPGGVGVDLELGAGAGEWFWSAWRWYQFAGVCGGLVAILVAGIVIWALFFALPGGIFVVPEGVDMIDYWRDIMDRRAKVRGRITKRLVLSVGLALGLAIAGIGLVWISSS